MDILNPTNAFPESTRASLFLAGPSPRGDEAQSWRPEAIAILRELGFTGTVFSPEPPHGRVDSYIGQIDWERECRQAADILVFWVPRDLKTLPGFTTNIEFGEDEISSKILYGRPGDSPKNKYLDARWRKISGEEPMSDLRALLARAVNYLGAGAERHGADARVPLNVWRTAAFQKWHSSVVAAGNKMVSFDLLRAFPASRVGCPPETPLFAFIAKAGVWDHIDERAKTNEFMLSRTDISCIAAFWAESAEAVSESTTLSGALSDPHILLIHEARQAVRNAVGSIFELPGGSSHDATLDPRTVAAEEFYEEAGLRVEPDRFVFIGERQLAASVLTHTANLFAVELTEAEGRLVQQMIRENRVLGTGGGHIEGGHSEERITLLFPKLSEMADYPLDWSSVGMAHGAWAALRKPAA